MITSYFYKREKTVFNPRSSINDCLISIFLKIEFGSMATFELQLPPTAVLYQFRKHLTLYPVQMPHHCIPRIPRAFSVQ